jgi:hypothetical protein
MGLGSAVFFSILSFIFVILSGVTPWLSYTQVVANFNNFYTQFFLLSVSIVLPSVCFTNLPYSSCIVQTLLPSWNINLPLYQAGVIGTTFIVIAAVANLFGFIFVTYASKSASFWLHVVALISTIIAWTSYFGLVNNQMTAISQSISTLSFANSTSLTLNNMQGSFGPGAPLGVVATFLLILTLWANMDINPELDAREVRMSYKYVTKRSHPKPEENQPEFIIGTRTFPDGHVENVKMVVVKPHQQNYVVAAAPLPPPPPAGLVPVAAASSDSATSTNI